MNKKIDLDLKNTLFMPSSKFVMKANLPILEPKIQDFWKTCNIYQKILLKNFSASPKIIFDGPPYANGNIHVGHALNKILKDVILRFYLMKGYYSEYIMGWDIHGLPIENNILKKDAGAKNWDYEKIRSACKIYAMSQAKNQSIQFEKIGLMAIDYKKYYTSDPKYISQEIKTFFHLFNKQYIYRGIKPICWSWSSQTALAEAEIEYREIATKSVYVLYKLEENVILPPNTYLMIWTTTPWTLTANFAIAISSKIQYSLIKSNNNHYIIAKDLVGNFFTNEYTIEIKNINYHDLIKLRYKSKLNNKINPIILGHHVTIKTGTGLVHISPYHGEDDFILGKEYKIESFPAVNKKGIMINSQYDGCFYQKANKQIIEDLQKSNLLYKVEDYIHEYPHDWRTNKPIYYLATRQWFIDVDVEGKEFEKIFATINFMPAWGKKRLHKMLLQRKEWCISRQRKWGIPIIAAYDKNNELIIFNHKEQEQIIEYFQNNSLDNWFNEKIINFLNNPKIHRLEKDILDVWFDSGVATQATKSYYEKEYSSNEIIFIEGSDQYRGWFNSSFLIQFLNNNQKPAVSIFSHGFVLDNNNIKMSKSKGNVIDPIKIINNYGADVLRLWSCSSNFHADILIGQNIIQTISNVYRKFRNTLKFMISNISKIKFETVFINEIMLKKSPKINQHDLNDFDNYTLLLLNRIITAANNHYNDFSYNKIIIQVEEFITNFLSSKYFEMAKNVLYVKEPTSLRVIQIQKTLFILSLSLARTLAPIMPHTCEEFFQILCEQLDISVPESIFLLPFLDKIDTKLSEAKFSEYNNVIDLFNNQISYALAKASDKNNIKYESKIKNQLETAIFIEYPGYTNNFEDIIKNIFSFAMLKLYKNKNEFANAFIENICYSSFDDNIKVENGHPFNMIIAKHSGIKCDRCWKFFDTIEIVNNENFHFCKDCNLIVNKFLKDI